MDKIAKLLKKLSEKEQSQLEKVLESLLEGETESLDLKKLKGTNEIYRARVGALRVIFEKSGKDIRVLEISRRDEKTYRNY